jgi:hypothetical protein
VEFKKDMVLADAFEVFSLGFDGVSGIQDQSGLTPGRASAFSVYPNPVREQLTISFTVQKATEVRLELYDMLGKRIEVLTEGRFEPGSYSVERQVGGYPPAAYLLKMNDGEQQLIKRIMILEN